MRVPVELEQEIQIPP